MSRLWAWDTLIAMKKRLGLLQGSRTSESGQVIVLMALLLVGLIGAAALVVDGGRAYSERRSVQNAADNAALAAALAMCQDGDETAVRDAGRASATQNGFTHGVNNVSVIVSNPPVGGPNADEDEFVEVVINAEWQPSFLQVLSGDSGPLASAARAVARCVPGSSSSGPVGWGNGLIALDSDHNAVLIKGSGCLSVTGGGVFVNSSNGIAISVETAACGGSLKADWVQVVGGFSIPSWGSPAQFIQPYPPQTGQAPRENPLASLEAPNPPAPPSYAPNPSMGGCSSNPYVGGHLNLNAGYAWCSGGSITLYPGRYASFRIGSDANVILQPGLYYVDGDVEVGGSATVNGSGVRFYVTSGSVTVGGSGLANLSADSSGILFHLHAGNLAIQGSSGVVNFEGFIYVNTGSVLVGGSRNLNLSAPSIGPYSGMVVFMGHGNTSNFIVNGSGSLSMAGTLYAPDARVESSGSGSNKTVNGQFIAKRFEISGGGARLNVDYNEDVIFTGGGGPGSPSKIELSE